MTSQLLATIENSKAYTLAVAEAMPANNFAFKPTKAVFSFAELLTHIGYGITWWEKNYIKRTKTDWAPDATYTSKKEVVQYLNRCFDALKETVNSTKLDETVIHGVFATLDHITHHRGQATVYLRLNGITPPDYMF